MKPYSKGLRVNVLEAVDPGMLRKEVAEVFGGSVSSIKRWLKRRRETGDVEPKRSLGPPAHKREGYSSPLTAVPASNDPLCTLASFLCLSVTPGGGVVRARRAPGVVDLVLEIGTQHFFDDGVLLVNHLKRFLVDLFFYVRDGDL
jgi:hypothetical protein